MKIRAISTDGDWVFGKGKSNYKTGKDAIMENIRSRLLSWKGDCFFAPAEGVDYNNFLSVGTKVFLDRDVKRVILQSEGVLRINTFISSLADRGYSASAEVTTIYGVGTIGV